jgi:hypothetical protein
LDETDRFNQTLIRFLVEEPGQPNIAPGDRATVDAT